MAKRAILGLLLASLAWAAPALAQSIILPPSTVYGRLAIGTGPGQAIPFAAFLANLQATTIPVVHPSSSNLVGTGCSTPHQLWYVDQNLCGSGDTWILNSSDPSALLSITVGGTVTNGDTVALTFKFGAGPCVAPTGCTVTAAVTGASTLTTIAANLVTLIQANANLYNNVAGAQKQILRLSNSAGQIDFDFDSRVPMIVTKTVTGAATETVTVPANCATACDKGWDVNPTLVMGRLVTGLAPPSNSQMFGLVVQGGSSVSPSAFDTQYGVLALTALSSTSGAVSSRWTMLTPNAAGVNNQGIFVGAGLYSPARTDKGNNTANFSELWTADVNSITRSASTWIFNATTNDKIQFLSGTISAQINTGGVAFDLANSAGATLARLGSAGSSLGQLTLAGNTSGSGTLTPLAAAGASVIWTLPSATGTIAVSATSPLSLNATTGNLTLGACTAANGACLDAVSGFASTGMLARTGSGAYGFRTITGTANQIGVTNGDGVSGNPTLALAGPFNATTFTSNGVLYGNASGVIQATAQGSNRSVLVGNAGNPSFSATPSITSLTLDNGLTNGLQFAAASGTNGTVTMGVGGSVLFTLGSALDAFAVNDHSSNTILNVAESTPGTLATAVLTFSGTNQSTTTSTGSIQTLGGIGVAKDVVSGGSFYSNSATFMNRTKTTFTNNAAAATATLTNSPTAGNPTKWIGIDDNGTTRFIPAW